ncbi:hypothetical protein LL06_22625 [Hoeflea sp. BAL378]|uniref:hypothetical protein n=1 Tax=Hoeflea sp. BAL378 TaxID=1547437 RepID=UPI000513E525|nr:hypothetical protein [Hoeflea sp. BAL378]KGF67349.1 hypothetical protein LL06_22625 [Hoeflea sp. BAL378]
MQRIKIIGVVCALAMLIAGCNSTEQGLQPIPAETSASSTDTTTPVEAFPAGQEPFGAAPVAGAQAPSALPAATTPAAAAPAQASLPAGQARGRIRFMPVIGAPVNAVTPLSRRLAVEARNRGLAILSASDPGGEHVLKGYFSADNFDGQTTVFYVWDVLDAAGNRLHRIQGQESVAGGPGDPWATVPADVMERIAARSIADYAAWAGL